MPIQTQKERNPPVRNIRRDSIETQVQTELVANQAGLKAEQKSGIHSLYAEDVPKKNETPEHGILHKIPSGKLQLQKYNIARTDSEGSQTIEAAQAMESAGESLVQMGGTIRTAVSTSARVSEKSTQW